jgi:hypothetical protein
MDRHGSATPVRYTHSTAQHNLMTPIEGAHNDALTSAQELQPAPSALAPFKDQAVVTEVACAIAMRSAVKAAASIVNPVVQPPILNCSLHRQELVNVMVSEWLPTAKGCCLVSRRHMCQWYEVSSGSCSHRGHPVVQLAHVKIQENNSSLIPMLYASTLLFLCSWHDHGLVPGE